MEKSISIFVSYAHKDENMRQELEKHLSHLKQQHLIKTWHDGDISAGTEWEGEITIHLNTADIILLLISPDFLASSRCYSVEMKQALERHARGEAQVIPVILRAADWQGAPFGTLQALPPDAKPIQSASLSQQDEAFFEVARGVRKVVEVLLEGETRSSTEEGEGQREAKEKKKLLRFGAPFPAVWNVPYRHADFFTGRDHLLEQLFADFTSEHRAGMAPVQALRGLGGLGKTQTATEYAYRYRQEYRAVLWVRAETDEDLVASFKAIAGLLKRPQIYLQNRQSLLTCMQEWFMTTTDWLLIFDNADNLALIAPFLPKAARGHLLLTTRATAVGNLAQPLVLDTLRPEDGALCILRRAHYVPWNGQLHDASQASMDAAQTLSQLMDGLPLALEQAGAYIEATGRSVSGYLELYRHYRPQIQQRQYGVVPNYQEPVAFAWKIARDLVEQKSVAASELLRLCAYLAPDTIPYEIFQEGAIALGPILGPVAADPLALDSAIALLRDHSLLKREVDHGTDISRLSIHRMMQEILRDDMDPQTQCLWAERAVRAVVHALPTVECQMMQSHARICVQWIEQWNMTFPEAKLLCRCVEETQKRREKS